MRLKTSNAAGSPYRRGIPCDGVEFQLASISQSHLSVRALRDPFPPYPSGVFVPRAAILRRKKTKNISRAFSKRQRASPLIKNSKRTCQNGGFFSPCPPTESTQFSYSRKPRTRLRRLSFSTFNYFPVRISPYFRRTPIRWKRTVNNK